MAESELIRSSQTSSHGSVLQRSELFAIESERQFPSVESDQALRDSLALLPDLASTLDPKNMVWAVSFSPNGKYLATGGDNGIAQVWNLSTKREVARVEQGKSELEEAVAFSPGSKYLAPASSDNTAQIHYVRAEDLIREACSRLPRNLTKEEWRQYLPHEPYRKTCPKLPEPR